LVFGDDSTPGSDVCWLWVNNQRWEGWRLEVVTAHLPRLQPPPSGESATLHEWVPPDPREPFAEAGFAEVAQLTGDVDPRLALCRTADLVAIGARGPGVLKSLGLGSTAEYLLHDPPGPIVIARGARRVRRVMVCTDGSPHAERALRAFATLPWAAGTDVHVVSVDDGRTDADRAAAAAKDELAAAGTVVETSVLRGQPTEVLVHEIEHHVPDLVVLGTRGLTGLRRLRVGSTAGAIARALHINVLLASDGDAGSG
jgi:nucleotide-binding universal stress UspA family protein